MSDNEKLISELKAKLEKANEKLAKTQKELDDNVRSRMTIFSNLSHEIRTPLNGIIGFSEMLNGSSLSSEEKKLYSQVISESGHLLLTLINDVMDIARVEANSLKVYPVAFDLNDLFFNIFMEFKDKADAKNLQFFLENLISEPFIIHSDPDVLRRILVKLIENAIKFTKSGWVKIKYIDQAKQISFLVEDTGIGVAEQLRSNLFNRFISEEVSKSRNIGGTGLDLSLCNGLVRLLGGKIWYEPKDEGGSIFHFTIQK